MGLIKLNKYDLPNAETARGYSTIKVKGNPVLGHVPLLKIFDIQTRTNDYLGVFNKNMVHKSVIHDVKFESAHRSFSVYTNMREFTGQLSTISMTMLSVLGMQGQVEELVSQGERRSSWGRHEQKVIVTTPVDVFVLAMMKPSDIRNINFTRNHIEFDASLVTLFMSEEKFTDKTYFDEHYNKTVAKYLRHSIGTFVEEHNIKTEVVPDNILKQYYRNPYSIENNSVFELMEIDKQVKDKVFSNINDKFLVHV